MATTTAPHPHRRYVINRRGEHEPVKFDQITSRIEKCCQDLDVDPIAVTAGVALKVVSGMKTSEIDDLVADYATSQSTLNPDYSILAGRIRVSNIHRLTSASFYETMKLCYDYKDIRTGKPAPLVTLELVNKA
jgi:ribonucleoside-diphosphate reductase alpha chain